MTHTLGFYDGIFMLLWFSAMAGIGFLGPDWFLIIGCVAGALVQLDKIFSLPDWWTNVDNFCSIIAVGCVSIVLIRVLLCKKETGTKERQARSISDDEK